MKDAADGGFPCSVCLSVFPTPVGLALHLQLHLAGGSYNESALRALAKRKAEAVVQQQLTQSQLNAQAVTRENRELASQNGFFNFSTALSLFSSLRFRFRVGSSAIGALRSMMGDYVGRIKTVVIESLRRHPMTALSELAHLIDTVSLTTEQAGWPDQMQTTTKEASVRRKEMPYVSPHERLLGVQTMQLPGGRTVDVKHTCMGFHLKDTLQRVLMFEPGAYQKILNFNARVKANRANPPERLTDLADGPALYNHPISVYCDDLEVEGLKGLDSVTGTNPLHLMSYGDEVGMENPIGNCRNNHKCMMVYTAVVTLGENIRYSKMLMLLQHQCFRYNRQAVSLSQFVFG